MVIAKNYPRSSGKSSWLVDLCPIDIGSALLVRNDSNHTYKEARKEAGIRGAHAGEGEGPRGYSISYLPHY